MSGSCGGCDALLDRRLDGTATWSLVTGQHALRRAPDGLAQVSTHTIGCVLHEAGYTWQQDRPSGHKMKRARIRPSPILVSIGKKMGEPGKHPHDYAKNGTAKLLTLFHPASGKVRVKGVTTCPNAVLQRWLQQELTEILALLPAPASTEPRGESRSLATVAGRLTHRTGCR